MIDQQQKTDSGANPTRPVSDSPAIQSATTQPATTLSGPKSRRPGLRRLRLLPRVLSTAEKLIVLLALFAFFGGAVWWGLRNYLENTVVVADQGGSLNLGLVGQPRYVNPLLSPTSDVDQDLSTLIFSSLFKLDKDFALKPDLAESISVSPDQKVYTVVLKQNLKWHDGVPLTADDVVFTVKTIQDPNWNSPLNLGFKGIAVAKVDERTVTFTLQEVYAPFQSTLTFGILPEHLWAQVPGANATLAELNTKPIGSGPYKFDELTKDRSGVMKRYHLLANADYYGGAPFISEINVTFYEQEADLIQAYRDRDINVVSGVPFGEKSKVEGGGTVLLSLARPRYDAIFINANNNGLIRPAAVRQALSHAIKKSDLVDKVLLGNGQVVHSPLIPGSLGYSADVPIYGYDPAKALELLRAEDFEQKEGGHWFKGADKLSLQIVTADTPENTQLANLIKTFWETLGIETQVVSAPVAELQQTYIRERKYQTLLFGEVIGADPDLYPFWHSTQIADPGLNLTSFSNDDLDKLLEEARQTTDPTQRAAKQTEISRILARDVHAIYLYSPNYLLAVRDDIKGIDLKNINLPADRFNQIQTWYLHTKRVPKTSP